MRYATPLGGVPQDLVAIRNQEYAIHTCLLHTFFDYSSVLYIACCQAESFTGSLLLEQAK
jgi:hypothetical protein